MSPNTAQGQKRSLEPTSGETFNTPRKRQHIESNKEQLIPLSGSQFESLVFHYPVLDSIASQLPNNDIYNIYRCSKFLQKSFQPRLYKEVHILKSAHLLQILKIIDVVKKYCKKLVIAVTDESKDFPRVYHIALEPSYLEVLETLPQNLHIFEATSRSQPMRVNPIIANLMRKGIIESIITKGKAFRRWYSLKPNTLKYFESDLAFWRDLKTQKGSLETISLESFFEIDQEDDDDFFDEDPVINEKPFAHFLALTKLKLEGQFHEFGRNIHRFVSAPNLQHLVLIVPILRKEQLWITEMFEVAKDSSLKVLEIHVTKWYDQVMLTRLKELLPSVTVSLQCNLPGRE